MTKFRFRMQNRFTYETVDAKRWTANPSFLDGTDQVVSKYINRHRIKVQTDLTYVEQMNRVLNTYEANWVYRLQLEIGI